MSQNNPVDYYTLIPGSFKSETLDTTGFVSTWIAMPEFSTINVSCYISSQPGVLSIQTNSIREDGNSILFFETTLAAGQAFFRRFKIPNTWIRLTFKTTSGSCPGYITTSLNKNQAFSAYSFINSTIKRNTDVELYRIANSFDSDLVRNLHEDFEKVNIQGIQKTIPPPNAEHTIGLDGINYAYPGVNNQTEQLWSLAADDNDTGVGAQGIQYVGVLSSGQPFNSNYGTSGSLLGLEVRTINRAKIYQTGASNANVGTLTLRDSVDTTKKLAFIDAGENVSHTCVYGVATNKELVIRDINIAGRSDAAGLVKIIEMTSTGIEYVLGEFLINSSYQQFNYKIDGLVPADSVIKINFKNTSTVATGDILINVNCNGMLCPTPNNF